jgi:hypothetical protein
MIPSTHLSSFTKPLMLVMFLLGGTQVYAQEETSSQSTSRWEAHIGIGLNIGANGLPSQVANGLAQKEGYITSVTDMRGLPLGASIFSGFGYRFAGGNHSMGFEWSIGIHNDGGRARVTLGDDPANIPGYVFDGARGAGQLTNLFASIQDTYAGLSTLNTMKGQYLDPKFRVYYRYRQPSWKIQTGLGLGLLIPFNYFAYPSKIRSDYTLPTDRQTSLFDMGWTTALAQGPITVARIPFPLARRDGTVMMLAIQPLLDLHVRASYKNYYLDVTYSTEFRHIHHLKIGLGMLFS